MNKDFKLVDMWTNGELEDYEHIMKFLNYQGRSLISGCARFGKQIQYTRRKVSRLYGLKKNSALYCAHPLNKGTLWRIQLGCYFNSI